MNGKSEVGVVDYILRVEVPELTPKNKDQKQGKQE